MTSNEKKKKKKPPNQAYRSCFCTQLLIKNFVKFFEQYDKSNFIFATSAIRETCTV